MNPVPPIRVRKANSAPVNDRGDYVLYWMVSNRRAQWNFSLDHAVYRAFELQKPLVVLEALRVDCRWASDRFHAFIFEGMNANRRYFTKLGICYHPYMEPAPGEGRGLLESLGKRACLVVSDEFPCFFIPRMLEKAAEQLPVRLDVVDSNGLFPMRVADRAFTTAYSFRRFLQNHLPDHLHLRPRENPFEPYQGAEGGKLPPGLEERWPAAEVVMERTGGLSGFPIDHKVFPGIYLGGRPAALEALGRFVDGVLPFYHERRNDPEKDFTSGLSPYLHFGHISSHEIFDGIALREEWSAGRLSTAASGGRSGWWGMGEGAEAFLDQLVTWRELGFNMCAFRSDYDEYDSLPGWALSTLTAHEKDPRSYLYTAADLEKAGTHDSLWNAAQRQLLIEGRIQGYLRMLWGKKILQWSESPRKALEVMMELNNKYALDGRDPNSYSGIFWVLGRYDRPWGPERPVFGKIRYMSSENTARKMKVEGYISKFLAQGGPN